MTAATSAPAPSRLACSQRLASNTQHTGILSRTQTSTAHGLSVVTPLSPHTADSESDSDSALAPYAAAPPPSIDAALSSPSESPYPPPFSSLYFPSRDADESPPAFAAAPPFTESSSSAAAAAAATKAALPRDHKDGSSSKDIDDGEPPPPYSEGDSPLESFTYVMASAGGPASIITQVSQTSAGPPINTLGGSDENITLELRYLQLCRLPSIAANMCAEAPASRSRETSCSLFPNLSSFHCFLMASFQMAT